MIPVALLLLLAARWPEATSLPNVDEFHNQVLRRFSDGKSFGMSRVVRFATFGRHFRAPLDATIDFQPENDEESAIIDRWNQDGWQTGIYVFGAPILTEPQSALLHRSLKGPAVLNGNTQRAELPLWGDVYPIASEAMLRFQSGARSHTARLNGWTLHARPVAAAKQTCVECHTNGAASDGLLRLSKFAEAADGTYKEVVPPAPTIKVGDTLGGVIYMYRRGADLK